MRIVQVSAHFPPELVSGGTLQPQRIAQGLRAAGHEVVVLAGSLDTAHPDFARWATTDASGLEVEWIATRPYIWWDAIGNYENREVADAAADLYDRFRPDVVHCHSLQTLGVGPVDAAAERGIPVVVTMHDFWWICARQFLVDTEDHPCCLVVAASDCPCEDGRAHLDRRTARLRRALDQVQLVLTPSQAAADVLLANGVTSPIEVDENGVPTPAPDRARHGRLDHVVVRYTGGSNPMKGADVLLAALAEAGPLQHVEVIAHDVGEALARARTNPAAVGLSLAPAYAPEDLDDVLANTSVLIVPSVMRETYSIVTREALARRLPVIATDVLGPEEVIEHDRNGLILPADDPGAVAAAPLRRIDADPTIVDRWHANIEPLHLRSVADQVSSLGARYGALADRPRPTPHAPVRVLFVVGIQGAPLRYRVQLPKEALALLGHSAVVRHYLDPELDASAGAATHVVVYRAPATPTLLDQIGRWRNAGTPVAFDVDDLIFDPAIRDEIPALQLLQGEEARLWLEGVNRYRTTMGACDAYIGSTAQLVEHAAEVVGLPTVRFDNGVGAVLGAASDRALRRPRLPGPLRVGYLSGTTTHDDDWRWVAPAVLEALDRHPAVELWLAGHLTVDPEVSDALGTRLRRLPFSAWTAVPEVLRDLDVNLAPLAPASRFNDAKSAIKWLEAALCETPTIATATRPFIEAIRPGRTGFLASTLAEWTASLDELLSAPSLARTVGRAARRDALLRWAPHLQAERYLAALDAVAAAHETGARPLPGWAPVMVDERPDPGATVEPYPPPAGGPGRSWLSSRARHERTLPPRWQRPIARVVRSLRNDGVLATARKVPPAIERRRRRRRGSPGADSVP